MTFWLPPLLREATTLGSNKARPGDADYGIKPAANRTPKPKGGGSSRYDASKHPRGGKGTAEGGKFVKAGDHGAMVATVQRQLGLTQTGTFDAGTAASIIAFQKRHGLVVDGIVGRQTALALTGQFDRARKAGPGSLGDYTSKLVGGDSRPASRSGSRRSRKGSGTGSARPAAQRVRGGALLAMEVPLLLEDVIDVHGFVHDALGKFAPKLGKHGKTPQAGHAIPEYDPKGLTFGKSAGGSNGARIATHQDGSKWLVKAYKGNEDRVATELLANAVYREMGANVPRAGRIKLHNGKSAISYPLLEGKPRPHVFQKRGAQPSPELGQHFMTDALLANWDVAGLEDDNILWNKAGTPFRVDQGGTLEFRAQGGKKDYGPVPYEVTSMLMPGGQARRSMHVSARGLQAQAKQISETLTPERIDKLVDAAGFKDAGMRERVRRALKGRVDWMGKFARGEVGFPNPPKPKPKPSLLEGLLQEAAIPHQWEEALHPRDQFGKFIKKIGGLPGGKSIQLDSKTTIKKDKDGTFRVVRSGGIIKGFKTPEDAARAALDRSVKSKDADSVGGNVAHKDFNAYLQSRGVNPKEPTKFGGTDFGATGLASEVERLTADIAAAKASGDKYEERRVPTLEARLAEAKAKLKAQGGDSGPVAKVPLSMVQAGSWDAGAMKLGATVQVGPTTKVTKNPDHWVVEVGGVKKSYASPSAVKYAVLNGQHHVTAQPLSAKLAPGHKVGDVLVNPALPNAGKWEIIGSSENGKYWNLKKVGTNESGTIKKDNPAWKVDRSAATSASSTPATTTMASMKVGDFFHNPETKTTFKITGENSLTWKVAAVQKGGGMGPEVPMPKSMQVGAEAVLKKGVHADQLPDVEKQLQDVLAGKPAAGAAAKPAKKVSGPQTVEHLQGATGSMIPLGTLALAKGDVIQKQKGGWKYTVVSVPVDDGHTHAGYVKVQSPKGTTKFWPGYAKVGLVTKADKSPVALKAEGAATPAASAAPAGPSISIPTIESALSSGATGKYPNIESLPDGAVIKTPQGQVGVLKKSEPAYTGYLTAYDIKTGAKFEPHATKYKPHQYSDNPDVMKAAAEHVAKAQAGTKVTTASGASGTVGKTAGVEVGPPAQFSGVPSWAAAKPHIPTAGGTDTDGFKGSAVGVTPEEREAIKWYTGSGYSTINGHLRKSESVGNVETAKRVKALDTAIAKSKVTEDVWIGRRTTLPEWKSNAKASVVIMDNGFLSTSVEQSTWSGDIQLHILIRKGSNALYVDGISSNKGEREVLLPRGSQFNVLKREEKGSQTVLYVEMI